MTGHSLGGGLATLAALSTHKTAFVFDPVGISRGTLVNYNIKDADVRLSESNIHSFIAIEKVSDPTGYFVDIISGASISGRVNVLGSRMLVPLWDNTFNLSPLDIHAIGHMISSLIYLNDSQGLLENKKKKFCELNLGTKKADDIIRLMKQ